MNTHPCHLPHPPPTVPSPPSVKSAPPTVLCAPSFSVSPAPDHVPKPPSLPEATVCTTTLMSQIPHNSQALQLTPLAANSSSTPRAVSTKESLWSPPNPRHTLVEGANWARPHTPVPHHTTPSSLHPPLHAKGCLHSARGNAWE